MIDLLLQYGLFLAKVVTIVVAALFIIVTIANVGEPRRHHDEDGDIVNINNEANNNEENDKDVLAFKNWFQQLEEYIYKLIKRRTTLGITKEGTISSIKIGNNRGVSTKLLVPININVSKCILNDDGKRNKILFNCLTRYYV